MENRKTEASQKTVMGILAYIGPLVIVSYLTSKDDPFVKFHIKQGLVLLVIEVAAWFLGMVFWPLWLLFNLVNLVALILSIIGIIHAAKGNKRKLPWVGEYAKYFTF